MLDRRTRAGQLPRFLLDIWTQTGGQKKDLVWQGRSRTEDAVVTAIGNGHRICYLAEADDAEGGGGGCSSFQDGLELKLMVESPCTPGQPDNEVRISGLVPNGVSSLRVTHRGESGEESVPVTRNAFSFTTRMDLANVVLHGEGSARAEKLVRGFPPGSSQMSRICDVKAPSSPTAQASSGGNAGVEVPGGSSGGAISHIPVLDNFARRELPLANGKWAKASWTNEIGSSWRDSWHGYGADGPNHAGAYWRGVTFSDADGSVVVGATLGTGPDKDAWSNEFLSLWLDMPNPSKTRSGYEVRFTGAHDRSDAYKVEIARWIAGQRRVLAKAKGISLPVNTKFALSETDGSLVVWKGRGTLSPILSAMDSTFHSGFTGIEANRGEGTAYDFRAGNVINVMEEPGDAATPAKRYADRAAPPIAPRPLRPPCREAHAELGSRPRSVTIVARCVIRHGHPFSFGVSGWGRGNLLDLGRRPRTTGRGATSSHGHCSRYKWHTVYCQARGRGRVTVRAHLRLAAASRCKHSLSITQVVPDSCQLKPGGTCPEDEEIAQLFGGLPRGC